MQPDPIAASLPRIGMVCSDPLRLLGVQTILEDGVRCHIVAVEGGRAADLHDLEVVILDASGTDHLLELIGAFRQLRPQLRLIVIGDDSSSHYIEQVIGAGSKGYLLHKSSEGELRSALEVVRDGSLWAPRKVLSRLIELGEKSRAEVQLPDVALTTRERQVLALLHSGRSNREIGQELGLEEGTVKAHMARLMRKAVVSNRTALILRASELGWQVD